jgi:2-oxoglutarate ferredoxin oxidoreductase subunit gamma
MTNPRKFLKRNSRYEIRMAGSGGQGIILAGIILAEAAILDGKHVAQSQSYGPETRGGSSISEVILSDKEIDYPRVLKLDLLVALTQEACDRNVPDVKTEGLVVVDSDLVHGVLWGKVASIPFWEIAREVGEERAINMAALGAIGSLCPMVSRRSLLKVLAKTPHLAKVAANRLAFDEALKVADHLRGSLKSVDVKEEFEI